MGEAAMNMADMTGQATKELRRRERSKALADLKEGATRWPIWHAMAWQDILIRYRGSALGPFWLTISMGVMILALGVLYSHLFKVDINSYMPFLCLGLMSWSLISSIVNDACTCFVSSEAIIKQIKMPYSVHIYRMIWRNLIIAGHNIVVYVAVMLYFDIQPTLQMLWLLPGLFLVLVNAVWLALLLGLICARFRDVPQIIANLVQIAFFVTPVIWNPDLLGPMRDLAFLNPFYAFVDLLRSPLLNSAPNMLSWLVALSMTMAGWVVALSMFSRFRARISYWV